MNDIDTYLKDVAPEHKRVLEHIREVILKTAPEAEQTMGYGMPAFKYKKKPLIYFASFKNHMSLFPTSEPVKALESKLKDFKVSKGTIQFTVEQPIPDEIIQDLIRTRIKAIDS